ncbi:MAG: SufE family protein [Pseudomonadota bacterium]
MATPPIEDIVENFEFLDEWDDRYRYVIELGRMLEPLADDEHCDDNKVEGCVSQVWLTCEPSDGAPEKLHFKGDSDAHIVRGLVAIALAAANDKTPQDILATDMNGIMSQIGLEEHLTPQRANGLQAMIARIRAHAEARMV